MFADTVPKSRGGGGGAGGRLCYFPIATQQIITNLSHLKQHFFFFFF